MISCQTNPPPPSMPPEGEEEEEEAFIPLAMRTKYCNSCRDNLWNQRLNESSLWDVGNQQQEFTGPQKLPFNAPHGRSHDEKHAGAA